MRGFEDSLPMVLLRARETAMSFFRPLLKQHGVTEQQWRIIRILQERSELEFHELATAARILPPSLTGVVTRLQRDGLVKRRKLATDQRRLHVVLTPAGRALFGRISVEAEHIYQQLEAGFGPARLALLFEMLRDLIALPTGSAVDTGAAAETIDAS